MRVGVFHVTSGSILATDALANDPLPEATQRVPQMQSCPTDASHSGPTLMETVRIENVQNGIWIAGPFAGCGVSTTGFHRP